MDEEDICPTETALEVIGGKWKGMVLFYLIDSTRRFNELRRLIPNVTQRMLTKQLRDLEAHGIVHRKVYPEVPPRVEYTLTDIGKKLVPTIKSLEKWGQYYLKQQDKG